MHCKFKELAKWVYGQAEDKGFDCLTSQDWDDFKDAMEVAEKGMKCEYYYHLISEMEEEKANGTTKMK